MKADEFLHTFITSFLLLLVLLASSCTSSKKYQTSIIEDDYSSQYDQATLSPSSNEVLMPYNRIIDPAGSVIRYGLPSLENHSLDCALFPGGKILAVEDRFGVAFIDTDSKKLLFHLDYSSSNSYKNLFSTYSGIKAIRYQNLVHIYWGASSPATGVSFIMDAIWYGERAVIADAIPFQALAPARLAVPNDIAINQENGDYYMYVVLNGNNELTKMRLSDKKKVWTAKTGMAPFGIALSSTKAYVTNWAGPVPISDTAETAGIPFGKAYVDPRTGATALGSVSVIDLQTGNVLSEVKTGLHPNDIIVSNDSAFLFVANGNSDNITVIRAADDKVVETIPVSLGGEENSFIGDSPNALAIADNDTLLFVSNGMDNAVAVISLGEISSSHGRGKTEMKGFIPTEAYPAGLALNDQQLFVANLEGEGARVGDNKKYGIHQQLATVSIIPLPAQRTLKDYTQRVLRANLLFRTRLSQLLPRQNVMPVPVPQRIGEPSVFKHVVYVIKENKTYDQVFGDVAEGNGMEQLCVYGKNVTPNQHLLARQFLLMDNYYASGKSSAEGHSWTDAAIVTDYIEKNVRAWFRSYPHVLADAMAYNKEGFLWNNALDHGKTVRIYGEACSPIWPSGVGWKQNYERRQQGKAAEFTNVTTISRVRPILSPAYPCYQGQHFADQIRADAFISELMSLKKCPVINYPN